MPAWSLSAEWFAYVMFPLSVFILRIAARGKHRLGVVVTACLLAEALGAWLRPSINGMPFSLLRVMAAFWLGGCCYLISGHVRTQSTGAAWCGLITLLMLLFLTPLSDNGPLRATVAVSLSAATIGFLAVGRGLPVTFLSSRALIYGGKISFGIYMTHIIALMLVAKILPASSYVTAAIPVRILLLFAYFAIVLAMGSLGYHIVENRARHWMTKGNLRSPRLDTVEKCKTK